MKRALLYFLVLSLATYSMSAIAQQSVEPPPRPADSGPSLAATMQFIQDKLNGQGAVGYVVTSSTIPYSNFRTLYTVSNVVIGADQCSFDVTEKVDVTIDSLTGWDYREHGVVVKGDDLHRVALENSKVSLRNIEQIKVENMQSANNRAYIEQAHPEIVETITPDVFNLTLSGSKPLATGRSSNTIGKQAPSYSQINTNVDEFHMRDEAMANRLAKAFVHAIELCGGGNNDPF